MLLIYQDGLIKMKRIIANIYWVFKSKKSEFPYLATSLTVVGLTFMHLCQIFLILGLPSNILFPFEMQNIVLRRWLNASLVLTPLIILFFLVFKKQALLHYQFDEHEISKGKRIIPIYFIVSVLILLGLLIREGIKKGTL